MSPRLRAAGALVAVFLFGAAAGSAVTRAATARAIRQLHEMPRAEARHKLILGALDRRLALTHDQRARIEAILASHDEEIAALLRRQEPEVAPLVARVQGEIREALAPAQRPRFDEMAATYAERRRRAMGP